MRKIIILLALAFSVASASAIPSYTQYENVPAGSRSASSQLDSSSTPAQSILTGSLQWIPAENNIDQWLQLSMDKRKKVYGIAIKGSAISSLNYYVTTLKVLVSVNGTSWTDTGKVYQANNARDVEVYIPFDRVYVAQYVRIVPVTSFNFHAVRADLVTALPPPDPVCSTTPLTCLSGSPIEISNDGTNIDWQCTNELIEVSCFASYPPPASVSSPVSGYFDSPLKSCDPTYNLVLHLDQVGTSIVDTSGFIFSDPQGNLISDLSPLKFTKIDTNSTDPRWIISMPTTTPELEAYTGAIKVTVPTGLILASDGLAMNMDDIVHTYSQPCSYGTDPASIAPPDPMNMAQSGSLSSYTASGAISEEITPAQAIIDIRYLLFLFLFGGLTWSIYRFLIR